MYLVKTCIKREEPEQLGKFIFHSFLVTQEHLKINKTVPVSL